MQQTIKNEPKVELDYLHNRKAYIIMEPFSQSEVIRVSRNYRPAGFSMNTMEAYHSYYGIGFRIKGESIISTLDKNFFVHPGDVILISNELYHKSTYTSQSDVEGIRIQFTNDLMEKLFTCFDKQTILNLFDRVVIHISDQGKDKIKTILHAMDREYTDNSGKIYKDTTLWCLLQLFFINVLTYQISEQNTIQSTDIFQPVLTQALAYIEQNYRNDPSLNDTADAVSVSPGYLSRLFTKTFGISYSCYLNKIKINQAKYLLIRTNMPIIDISLECGFSSQNYFCYAFKNETGCSPLQYRKQHM